MAKENLAINEEHLGDVVDVIWRGIDVTKKGDVKHEVTDILIAWCIEMREYLHAYFDKEFWPKTGDEFKGIDEGQ